MNRLLLVFLVIGLVAALWAMMLRRRTGMPSGRVILADSALFQQLPGPLVDEEWGLVGKPDYVIAGRDGSWIPVEYKNAQAPAQPYAGHVLQLAAYLRLAQVHRGQRPTHGLIRYRDKTFQVNYSSELETRLREALQEMSNCSAEAGLPPRSHNHPERCRACGYRQECDQRLV